MFRKILVANRGEIAVRVIRTARRMGIATVAVYSDADRDALHVEKADEAVRLGPAPASQSYLAIERIVDACRQSGADAVHPGYGFLSERAAFAAALEAAGIAFIGPNARAIAAMGDKIESKKLAAAAGVSTIPGFLGEVTSVEAAIAAARDIGFPVMIKASAGGGGKGMRIARSDAELSEGWERARSEARSSFGDERVFLERFIENPRHIEVQVLGDRHGNIIHLGERECSIQRRNQKIIEEAPSPVVDEALRQRMGAEAVALAAAVGYDSAGTVEFVVGEDRRFYFLEMNTRLQVEHPVTELTTGLDLVEAMIRIAAGEPLALRQEDVRLSGSAIEVRLYAEDPYRGFLPSVGRLTRFRAPKERADSEGTVRVDSGVTEGSEVSIHFDPLMAKLIVHAPDRAAAIRRMAESLDEFVIDGVAHNQPFLSAIMDHPRWQEGRLSTAFIADEFPNGFSGIKPEGETLVRLAIVALTINLAREVRLNPTLAKGRVERVVKLNGDAVPLAVLPGGNVTEISLDVESPLAPEAVTVVSDWHPGDLTWTGVIGGFPLTVQVRKATAGVRLSWRGVDVIARVMTPRVAALDGLMPEKKRKSASKALLCPMPGLVVSILAEPGQEVRAGEPLAIVEAMKMENLLRAERDGKVAKVKAKPGDILAVDAVIMEFE